MKATASEKTKIGIFTTISVFVLLFGVFMIGKKKNMFGNTFHIYGTFKNVGGLQVGNNVRFGGINIGTVEGITIISDTLVRVDMRLQNKVDKFLKTDAVAGIGSDGLMGDKLVNIASGIAPTTLTSKGDRIQTINPTDFDKIMTKMTNVANNAESITNSLAGIFNQVSNGKGSLGRLLYSDTLARNLEGTVKEAKSTMTSIKHSSEGFGENMEALHHNILLRGYFKKKAKKAEKKKEEQAKKQEEQQKQNANDKDASKKQ